MKAEKRCGSYRVRKMIDGHVYSMTFDHKPTQKEIREEIFKRMQKTAETVKYESTFLFCAREYIDDSSKVLSPSTIRDYRSLINGKRIPSWFLELQMDDVNSVNTQKCISEYSETHAPKSVHNAYGLIRRVFVQYEPDKALHVNLPQKERYQKYVPTREEVMAIYEYFKGGKYEIMYRLALYGLRMGEALALTDDDIVGNVVRINKDMVLSDTGKRVLKKTPKTSDGNREVVIDDELVELIKERGLYTGGWHALDSNLRKAQDACGIHHFRWHDLRGFMCTELLEKGVDMRTVQAVGGWSDPSFVNRNYQKSRLDREPEKQKTIVNILKI